MSCVFAFLKFPISLKHQAYSRTAIIANGSCILVTNYQTVNDSNSKTGNKSLSHVRVYYFRIKTVIA